MMVLNALAFVASSVIVTVGVVTSVRWASTRLDGALGRYRAARDVPPVML